MWPFKHLKCINLKQEELHKLNKLKSFFFPKPERCSGCGFRPMSVTVVISVTVQLKISQLCFLFLSLTYLALITAGVVQGF
ncbi:hypothetical protein T4D_1096 [Trichinella pseudospiralis]|uniref:Uncharacterized protein n=1 Tax=Trichinella pseudospiralis TaxID=6337 RepID=A0A0V1FI19_TRIPS|nr:hypothetical protein T4D_1096 [Trichinella pseudospiralis]